MIGLRKTSSRAAELCEKLRGRVAEENKSLYGLHRWPPPPGYKFQFNMETEKNILKAKKEKKRKEREEKERKKKPFN
jgi:hypothetical protein